MRENDRKPCVPVVMVMLVTEGLPLTCSGTRVSWPLMSVTMDVVDAASCDGMGHAPCGMHGICA